MNAPLGLGGNTSLRRVGVLINDAPSIKKEVLPSRFYTLYLDCLWLEPVLCSDPVHFMFACSRVFYLGAKKAKEDLSAPGTHPVMGLHVPCDGTCRHSKNSSVPCHVHLRDGVSLRTLPIASAHHTGKQVETFPNEQAGRPTADVQLRIPRLLAQLPPWLTALVDLPDSYN